MDTKIHFNDGDIRHQCTAHRDNDWLVFTCKQCPGFERRIHMPSGQMKVQHGVDPWILHEGQYIAPGLDAQVSTAN